MSEVLRINFEKSYKLWQACEEDGSVDDKFEYVYFLNGYAYASNRHIVAKVPLGMCTSFMPEDYAKLNNHRIHRTMLKTLCSFNIVQVKEDWNIIDHNGKLLNKEGDPERFVMLSAASVSRFVLLESASSSSATSAPLWGSRPSKCASLSSTGKCSLRMFPTKMGQRRAVSLCLSASIRRSLEWRTMNRRRWI